MTARNNRFLAMANEDSETPCPGCGKPTYPSERPMLCLGTKWHPGCIKCTTCGITLSPRMMESYEKKPYCRAHRPDAKATATTVNNDFKVNQAVTVPKAARRQPGVDVTQRQTFYAGPQNKQLDQLQKQLHEDKTSINPRGFVPDRPAAPNRSRAQGVNKLEGTTFNETSLTNKAGSAPLASEADWGASNTTSYDDSSSYSNDQGGGYDQSGHDQGGYDQGGYDQGGNDQGGYEDQGGYDQGGDQGGYDQGGYDQGGYDQGGEGGYDQGGYDQGGYEQGGEGGYDQGYDQGGYDQGGYEQGGEGGYDQGYDQGGYEEGGY